MAHFCIANELCSAALSSIIQESPHCNFTELHRNNYFIEVQTNYQEAFSPEIVLNDSIWSEQGEFRSVWKSGIGSYILDI